MDYSQDQLNKMIESIEEIKKNGCSRLKFSRKHNTLACPNINDGMCGYCILKKNGLIDEEYRDIAEEKFNESEKVKLEQMENYFSKRNGWIK